MHYRDFPLGMRILLTVAITLSAVNLLLLPGAIVTTIGLFHPEIPAAAWTIAGAAVGASITFFAARHIANTNRKKEAEDIATSLHAEIADRAARCLNDYLVPWKEIR